MSGIKGQKWGVRRFRRKNGTETPAGRKRYKEHDEYYHKYIEPRILAEKALNKVGGIKI